MNCKDCCNYKGRYDFEWFPGVKQCISCRLDSVLHSPTGRDAEHCGWYNIDPTDKNICYNCKYYGGGCDWGLACSKHYHKLPMSISEVCEDYERK